jgi:predicted ATPase
MTGFHRIEIDGFRRLRSVNLELRPLCVLIGANGAGKSSFLDVLSMLAASAQGGLAARVSELGGLGVVMTMGGPKRLALGLVDEDLLEYKLVLAPAGNGYAIASESLSEPDGPGSFMYIDSKGTDIRYYNIRDAELVRPTWEHNPLETSLSQVPKMFSASEESRRGLASSTFYHALNVEQGSRVRLPQPMQPATLPGKDGEHLASCLYYLKETDRDRFEAIEASLSAAFPTFERLEFPPVAAGTLAMAWREKRSNGSTPFYAHQLSEGTLRFLWLTTLLQSPGLTDVTLIDEPEVSLHPELLSLFADLLREASTRSQIIVATHSDLLVRFLKPEEVIVVDMNEEGNANLTWADTLDLDQWLQEYTLDEVWRMGRMGGRR